MTVQVKSDNLSADRPSPRAFFPLAGRMIPWFGAGAVLLAIAGLYVGFFVAPTMAGSRRLNVAAKLSFALGGCAKYALPMSSTWRLYGRK